MAANRLAVVVLGLFTALLLQVTVLARLSFLGAKPDLVLVAVICFALSDGPAVGMGAGFGAGLVADLLGSHTVGLLALVLCVVGYAAGVIRSYFDRLSTFTPMAVVGGLTAAAVLAYAALSALLGDPRVAGEPVVRSLVLTSLYDVVLTPFVFAAVTALRSRGDDPVSRL
ncbi:MAG TPA: rod shape-determining protein MreD [Mycobacteriales bacterium]|nr:rod shape-determining protein MreD [Mycobacteriales bacterium]